MVYKTVRILLFVLLTALFSGGAFAQASKVVLLNVDGTIGPAVSDYLDRGISDAAKEHAEVVIIRMDTPGGLDLSMHQIVKSILSSSVPVIVYVAPSGARAASAGTFLLYASHVAAMAPGTHLGAASPVNLSSEVRETNDSKIKLSKELSPNQATMMRKVTNDAVAFIRSLAQLRNRNADWGEKAVRQAATLTEVEAKQQHVIEIIAKDPKDLLTQLNGRKISLPGQERFLKTLNLPITVVEPDWRTKFLSIITDPSVAYILLLMGIYGLFFEFSNPGFVLPGVSGAISLILALYAFQLLPISFAGLGLIVLGIFFMLVEAYMPSFGALGIGGIVSFVVGSVLLMDTHLVAYQVAKPVIFSMAIVTIGFFVFIIGMALKARRRHVVSGREQLLGIVGEVIFDCYGQGQARILGEIWQIKATMPLKKGDKIKVVATRGLLLTVVPLKKEEL
ncbi:MAG: nodulation protein NfeD [Proteobacteria bacterium]|nr:nodulation protein NfeD [Pseudomonadota bacterium]